MIAMSFWCLSYVCATQLGTLACLILLTIDKKHFSMLQMNKLKFGKVMYLVSSERNVSGRQGLKQGLFERLDPGVSHPETQCLQGEKYLRKSGFTVSKNTSVLTTLSQKGNSENNGNT